MVATGLVVTTSAWMSASMSTGAWHLKSRIIRCVGFGFWHPALGKIGTPNWTALLNTSGAVQLHAYQRFPPNQSPIIATYPKECIIVSPRMLGSGTFTQHPPLVTSTPAKQSLHPGGCGGRLNTFDELLALELVVSRPEFLTCEFKGNSHSSTHPLEMRHANCFRQTSLPGCYFPS